MSVIVKGMTVPEHCGYCRFSYDGICHALQRTKYGQDLKDGKLMDCPLVELPTSHGRLIDADKIVADTLDKHLSNHTADRGVYELCHAVNTAPTVIEAEDEEWTI